MKILVALAVSTRGGIDFFQSLLDKHSQISQFPGEIYIDDLLIKFKNTKSADEISDIFIENYQRYFDSSLGKVERHDYLGDNKNQFYKVSKIKFKKSLASQLKEKPLTTKNIICALHLAYSEASGEEIKKKKIIVLQIHHFFRVKSLKNLDYEIICTIRDPLGSYNSYVKNLAFFQNNLPSPWQFYFHLERTFNHLNKMTKLNKKISVIKLEDLHREHTRTMKNFCNHFELDYEDSLKFSTFHGLLWWGDKVSKKDLNGVNKDFKNNFDEKIFFKNDIGVIENETKNYLKKYSYKFRYKDEKIYKFLPFKFEITMLKLSIFNLNFINVLRVIYYYFKRIKMMNINKDIALNELPKKF